MNFGEILRLKCKIISAGKKIKTCIYNQEFVLYFVKVLEEAPTGRRPSEFSEYQEILKQQKQMLDVQFIL